MYNLQRFIDAQDEIYDARGTVFEVAWIELRNGRKENHWMWFIFPQIRGLGHSFISQKFAISGREEAQAYLDHPKLGFRLRECTRLVTLVEQSSPSQIFGHPDDLKFHSCMSLFSNIEYGDVFTYALKKYFAGQPDQATLDFLSLLN